LLRRPLDSPAASKRLSYAREVQGLHEAELRVLPHPKRQLAQQPDVAFEQRGGVMQSRSMVGTAGLLQTVPAAQLLHHATAIIGHVHQDVDLQIPWRFKRGQR
jgi:hypothetical protein